MRKLNLILLVLLAFSSMNIQAMDHSRASKRKRIHIDRLERWDHMTKHPDYIPLDATIEYISRLCFSYYMDAGDDGVLDIYGIRDWVESLPRKNISIATLANSYKIIGL